MLDLCVSSSGHFWMQVAQQPFRNPSDILA